MRATVTNIMADAAIKNFKNNLKGKVIAPGDPDYDKERKIWNRMIDRYPNFIVKCKTVTDIQMAIIFSKEFQLEVAIRGGGHNVAGNALCDGGLVIDLSGMKSIEVDPVNKTATVAAGVLLGELDQATQEYGLAIPAGIISETGVAGLTLGGGVGWLSRKYGLTIDSLLSAEMVMADASIITVSEYENEDLFWGIRGGGGNFGVVTSFTFKLHEVGPEVYTGLIVYAHSQAKKVMQYHREFVSKAPNELSAWQILRKAPPLPFLPENVHGESVLITAFCYAGSIEDGVPIMDAYDPGVDPYGTYTGDTPYVQWQNGFDGLHCDGNRSYWKSHNLKELTDECIDTFIRYAETIPSPLTEIFIPHLQGATAEVSNDATAYGHRDAPFLLNIHGQWQTKEEDEEGIKWVKDFFDATREFSTGTVYVNFVNQEGEERVKDAYTENTWKRLRRLKAKYDPENFFHINQNIQPAQTALTIS